MFRLPTGTSGCVANVGVVEGRLQAERLHSCYIFDALGIFRHGVQGFACECLLIFLDSAVLD